MLISIFFVFLGFILLIKGSDLLVEGASNIAKKFNIPDIIIGLTVVSIGTSTPELIVSVTSAVNGYSDMVIGNVIGSNMANIFLILGVSAFIKTIEFEKETVLLEIPMNFVMSAIFVILCNTGRQISRFDSIILLSMFLIFIIYTIVVTKAKKNNETHVIVKSTSKTLRNIISITLGIILLKIGGDVVVENAINISSILNFSEKITSIAILSIGTSLPELVTSITSLIKGKEDIAIGNILGSNTCNILLITGVSSLVKPILYNMSYNIEMIILILGTMLLILFPSLQPKNKMTRKNGILLCSIYCSYMISLLIK